MEVFGSGMPLLPPVRVCAGWQPNPLASGPLRLTADL